MRNSEFERYLKEALSKFDTSAYLTTKKGRVEFSDNVKGPFEEVFVSEKFQGLRRSPEFEEALRTLEPFGVKRDSMVPEPGDSLSRLAGLSNRNRPCSDAEDCHQPPAIERFESFLRMGLHCCDPIAAEPIRSTVPGRLMQIVGQNFSSDPGKNVVRFAGERAFVFSASPDRLVVIVPVPNLLEKSGKSLNYSTGDVPVTVETVAGTAERMLRIEKVPKAPQHTLDNFTRANVDILAKTQRLLAPYWPSTAPTDDPDRSDVRNTVDELPLAFGKAAEGFRQLNHVVRMIQAKDVATLEIVEGIIHSSGIMAAADAVNQLLDDSGSSLGKYAKDAICAVREFVTWVIGVLFVLLLVITIVALIVCIISLASGLGGLIIIVGVILTYIELLVWIWTYIKILLWMWGVVNMVYSAADKIEKIIDKGVQKVKEFWHWLWGEPNPS